MQPANRRAATGGVVGFHGGHPTRNLHPPAADLGTDHRRGHDLALALFEQDDGHALVDVLPRHVAEDACAFGVEREVDRGLLRLAIKAWLRVGQVLAGQDDLFLHDHRLAVALQIALRTKRHRALAGLCGPRLGAFVHQAHFQRGSAAQNVLGLGRVLHARQLHDDTVQSPAAGSPARPRPAR